MLDTAKLTADIGKQIAESLKLDAEERKREAEFSKLCHEVNMSFMAETLKNIQRQRSMWPLGEAALGALGAAALLAFGVVAGVVLAKVFA